MSILKCYEDLNKFIKKVEAKDGQGKKVEFAKAAEEAIELILKQSAAGRKVIFIGNGGSAAIANHMAIDFWKNGGMRTKSFSDSSLLTCISNDYGYKHVFEKPIEMFADPGDVLVAISSSGKSENILNGVRAAKEKGCTVITLSGFAADNPLFNAGDINFYVPSTAYSHVEIIHHTICHYILEMIMEKTSPTISTHPPSADSLDGPPSP